MRSNNSLRCTLPVAISLLHASLGWCPIAVAAQQDASLPAAVPAGEPDWGSQLLEQDPLEGMTPTHDDLLQALSDPNRRESVIERHFRRAEDLSREQQESLLRLALQSESPVVQRHAAAELKRLGLLEKVVCEILLDLLQDGDVELRRAAVVALERIEFDGPRDAYVEAVIETLASDDPQVRGAAERQLAALGAEAVPDLLRTVRTADGQARVNAAVMLSRIVGSKEPMIDAVPSSADAPSAAPPKFRDHDFAPAPARSPRESKRREVDLAKTKPVRVYFGTNRELSAEPTTPWRGFVILPAVLVALGAYLGVLWWRRRSVGEEDSRRAGRPSLGFTAVVALLVIWGAVELNSAIQDVYAHHQGPEFGPRRDSQGTIRYGHCEVTLPPTHKIGEVKRPWLGPEHERQHVVLKQTTLFDSDASFYDAVQEALSKGETDDRDCFVFVHGFNVTFADAARRTAQIHYDLKFPGVPLFYSWPSRGSLRHYPSDSNEIGDSQMHIRRFLTGVARHVDAGRIHVIAHSMGGHAVSRAIAEIEGDDRLFDQIILAAPDIDADVFQKHLVPRLARKATRTTLYCSRRDLALHVSCAYNDYPRAGDSSQRVIVADDLDTVDASEIPTDLLGHSYYGDGRQMLDDIGILFETNSPPADRKLQLKKSLEGRAYWTFGDS